MVCNLAAASVAVMERLSPLDKHYERCCPGSAQVIGQRVGGVKQRSRVELRAPVRQLGLELTSSRP